MAEVAIIGAGSIVFCQTLMLDILGAPGLEATEFSGRKPRPTPAISTPKGTAHAHVPVDPALAIAARFGEPAQ